MTTVRKVRNYPPTPELDKQRAAREEGHSDSIGAFLDWLQNERGVTLARYGVDNAWGESRLHPVHGSIESWLAEYFEIDLDKIEAERSAILSYREEIRSLLPPEDEADDAAHVYCHGCSRAAGSGLPVYHLPPVCATERGTP